MCIILTHYYLIEKKIVYIDRCGSKQSHFVHCNSQKQIDSHFFPKMGIPTDITLYTAGTPNGIKVSILLEELGLEYKVSFQRISIL